MNDSKIKVLLVEPEKYPKEIVIDDSLEAMQEVVGGDIEEYMPYDDDVAIICNEEGKMRGLTLMWIDIVNKRSYNFLYMNMFLHILLSPYIIYIIFYIICPQSDSK